MNDAVGVVCENGHIRDVAKDFEELLERAFCRSCGGELHQVCPNCQNAPIFTDNRSRDDGSHYWYVAEYCHECGEAFPWGPSRLKEVVQEIEKRIPESQSNGPAGNVCSTSQQQYLEQLVYGSEVFNHIQEGDRCYKYNLWHSALTSYIHGFEWAAIAYLEHEQDIDIIQKEQDGVYYNFAGGQKSILDELTYHAEIDQKTSSKIKSMNRAERRWMAHHKSGETLQDEVDAIRARLSKFIDTLFPETIVQTQIEDELES